MSSLIVRILPLMLVFQALGAMGQGNGRVASKVNALLQTATFQEYNLIEKREPGSVQSGLARYVREHEVIQFSSSLLEEIGTDKPAYISVLLPRREGSVKANLYQVSPFSSSFKSQTSDGRTQPLSSEMVFYHGALEGIEGSLCAVSIIEGEIRVMYADDSGAYRIHKVRGDRYVYFRDGDMLQPTLGECQVDEFPELDMTDTPPGSAGRSTGNCVEIYFECDFESYTDNNSSVSQTQEWVAELFNEVQIIYDNESIPISISQIFVWTSTDPYAGLNSTSAALNEFVDQISTNNYNGRLAHLLSTRSLGGGIAYVDVLCSQSLPCAVSASLSTNIVPFPDYSWNVNVVAHELGHNFGSRHTHRCVWNGNNTQIDDCGNEWASNAGNNPEGASCFNENNPILPSGTGGTVMSYCHLIGGVGINPVNGFGPQPGNLIRSEYNNASCSTGTCSAPECTSLVIPTDGQTGVSVNTSISWSQVAGANGYLVSIGTTPGGTQIANAVDNGGATSYDPGVLPFEQQIYVEITPYNTLGQASGCVGESFTTEANVPPTCTQLSSPVNGATNVPTSVTITWSAPPGNETGYLLRVGTTQTGGEILDDEDIGNVTSYLLSDLPGETEVFVRLTPYGTTGSASGCPNSSFTTSVALGGDQCAAAVEISCGTTAIGSTLNATSDNVSNCGTSVSAPGVWYKFVGTGKDIVLSMCGAADYDTKINVYRGSCGNLTCVTGNDDEAGCNYASQVEFTTTVGTDYFVLVNGWNGQTGNFALAMACANENYCPSQGIVADDEWIASVQVGSTVNTSGARGYSDFGNVIFPITPGATENVVLTPGFAGDSFSEYFRVWVDLDNDDVFESNELLIDSGPVTSALETTLTIPASTASGDYRMRVAMKYNSSPDDCEVFTYGEVEDYTLRVRCNVVTSATDSGPGSLREVLSCVSPGDTVTFAPEMANAIITLSTLQLEISSDVIIDGSGMGIRISAGTVNRTFLIDQGVDASFIDIEIIGGSATVGSAVLNYGTLKLEKITIRPNVPGEREVLTNFGELTIGDSCDIQNQ